jgi:magnesium-protoporphyrin IX monomethyl ester (oxidative) cyclase
LRQSGADYVVLGEGEQTLRELVEYCRGTNIGRPDGVAWREGAEIKVLPRVKFIANPDDIPLPARHLLDMERYFAINRPHGPQTTPRVANMITSRGCPGTCVFCAIHGIWGKSYRGRSVANVMAEIRELVNKYNVGEIQFEDDNLTFDRGRAAALFRAMSAEFPGLRWGAPNGVAVWALDDELVGLMAESGCHFVTLAVESGNQRVLTEVMRKPLHLAKAKHYADKLRARGVRVDAMFVIGLPGETQAEIEDTVRYALALELDDVSFFIATPYPGTALYEQCVAGGLLAADYALDKLQVHKRGFIKTPEFTPEEIVAIRQNAIDRFLESRLKRGWRQRGKFYCKRLLTALGLRP